MPGQDRLLRKQIYDPGIDIQKSLAAEGGPAVARWTCGCVGTVVIVARGAIPVDTAARANHGFVALAGTPGESHDWLEFFKRVRRNTQIVSAEDRC